MSWSFGMGRAGSLAASSKDRSISTLPQRGSAAAAAASASDMGPPFDTTRAPTREGARVETLKRTTPRFTVRVEKRRTGHCGKHTQKRPALLLELGSSPGA
jgi:hypothetical protein